MGKIVNKTELAEIVGKTQKTLTTWQQNGMPVKLAGKKGTGNQYDTANVIDWIVNREISKLTIDEDGQFYDVDVERGRLTHHQANKTALEEEILKRKLIPADEVEAEWSKMVSSLRAKMLAIPTKTAHKLINVSDFEEVESVLKSYIYEALKELSENEGNRAS